MIGGDPDIVDRLARSVVSITQDAETSLIEQTTRSLRAGIAAPDWTTRKLGDVTRLRAAWERDVDVYLASARTAIGHALTGAGEEGQRVALTALKAAVRSTPTRLPGAGGVLALAEELSGAVTSTRYGVLRSIEDIYRGTVSSVMGRVLLGGQTRLSVAQTALDRLVSSGVGGFTDARGRRWDLASYVEMSVRTGVQRAMVQAHADTLTGNGADLVMVSDAPAECKLCRPWEGKILSLSGDGARTLRLPSGVGDDVIDVDVAGSLAEARRSGLFHPNCRHSFKLYIPGVTTPPRPASEDPEGDAARRKLRALERNVRAAKRREAAAMSEPARARARADVRAIQARIRDHVASTSAKRQPQRERIGAAR